MIADGIAWAWVLCLLGLAYPVIARLLPDVGVGARIAVTAAVGAGALSLIMLWQGLLGIAYTPAGIALPYLIAVGIFYFTAEERREKTKKRLPFSLYLNSFFSSLRSLRFNFFSLFMLPIAAAIAFNAGYWAFHRDDAINIYQPHAAEIAQTRALIPLTGADSLYRAYPMHMQMLYAYSYIVAGWENDYLGQFVSALLALACLPTCYALAERLRTGSGGIAAFLLATTPTYGAWASSGYVDLPTALSYALSAWFALRLWDHGRAHDAAFAGLMLGLAAWTKNAALLGVPLLGAWLLLAWVRQRIGWRHIVIAAIACALVGAPFYIRNIVGAGMIIPDTAWTDQAERTLESALIVVTHPEIYGVTGWLILTGIAYAVAKIFQRREGENAEKRWAYIAILWWTIPFFAAWWWFASYDPRFLLVILPMMCALAGSFAAQIGESLREKFRSRLPIMRLIIVGIAIMLTVRAVWYSVEYKDEMLRAPLMSDADKRALLGRPFLETIPPES
jgi:hypothetical protein